MKETNEKDIDQIFAEGTLIDKALKQAVQEAILQHKKAGNPIAVWREGEIAWIKPEEISEAA